MIDEIIALIGETYDIQEGILHINNVIINEREFYETLKIKNCIENVFDIKGEILTEVDEIINKSINIQLSIYHLQGVGYYVSFDKFIEFNKIRYPELFYIADKKIDSRNNKSEIFYSYKELISLIKAITSLASHIENKPGINKIIIIRENKVLVLPINYSSKDIEDIKIDLLQISTVVAVLNETFTEKKLLYINELIDFLSEVNEQERFTYLLVHFDQFYTRCVNSFEYYIRNLSYNKLKLELDTKALDYTQKIQSVINESQTKLIAIPTAFVLACVAFDYEHLFVIKNYVTLLSLLIFSVLLQIFLSNQKSALGFISDNIKSYKESFKTKDINKISNTFALAESELNKQRQRLRIMEIILWTIPVSLLCLWLFLIEYHILFTIIGGLFLIVIIIYNIICR